MCHSHLALGILCIHLYLLCQSTCKTKKKKFELKKKNLKSSLRYFDSLKIKLAFIMSKLVIKIQDQKHRSQKGGIFLFRKPSNINLQAGNSQPNLHIRAIGMPMY